MLFLLENDKGDNAIDKIAVTYTDHWQKCTLVHSWDTPNSRVRVGNVCRLVVCCVVLFVFAFWLMLVK